MKNLSLSIILELFCIPIFANNYMDSCWNVYYIIDVCYQIDCGDAFDMDCVNSAECATKEQRFEDFKVAWTQVDKNIITFLLYRIKEEDDVVAFNLYNKFYSNEKKIFPF